MKIIRVWVGTRWKPVMKDGRERERERAKKTETRPQMLVQGG